MENYELTEFVIYLLMEFITEMVQFIESVNNP